MNMERHDDKDARYDEIEKFVEDLRCFDLAKELPPELSQCAKNFYSDSTGKRTPQAENLALYLHKMSRLNPEWLLVGEAPGCHGCKLSGIPFTSERVVAEHPFFSDGKFSVRDRGDPEKENTATIVWDYLTEKKFYPLMWNAYPFHPHEEGNPDTNRKPTPEELKIGRHFLERLIEIFGIKPENIIAVGREAEGSLMELGIKAKEVPHPSYGHKNDFINGLNDIPKQAAK